MKTIEIPNLIVTTNKGLNPIDSLRIDLASACHQFLNTEFNIESDVIKAAAALVIAQRIALHSYITINKVQQFANNTVKNDNITLTEEINNFSKKFNKHLNYEK
jgi:hypothetical protein